MTEQTLLQKAQCAAISQWPDEGPRFDGNVLDKCINAALSKTLETLIEDCGVMVTRHGFTAPEGSPMAVLNTIQRLIAQLADLERET